MKHQRPSATITTKVRCSGHLHAISLRPGGRFVLADHPDTSAERAFQSLGGQPVRCLEILRAWREQTPARLPAPLRPALRQASLRRQARAEAKARSGDPLLFPRYSRDSKRRPVWRVNELAREASDLMRSCTYRQPLRSAGLIGAGHCVSAEFSPEHQIRAGVAPLWVGSDVSLGMVAYLKIGLARPRKWDREVRQAGIAVIDGRFIFEVLERLPGDGLKVLAGRQLPDYTLAISEAYLSKAQDGNWHIRWPS